jgi:diguanylate cyclase (GGDEF)-like protein
MGNDEGRISTPIARNRLGRGERILMALAVCLVVAIGVGLTSAEVERVRHADAQTFSVRARLLEGYVANYVRVVSGLGLTVRQGISHPAPNGDLRRLRDYPSHGVFGLSDLPTDGRQESRVGSLSGSGTVSSVDASLRREIAAALELDAPFAAVLDRSSDFAWIYYTSARGFMYMAPKVGIDDFRFSPELYKREFWTQAVPEANPGLGTIVTPLYEDAAGKGLMISVSEPVVADGGFLGVVSADIGIETLRGLLAVGASLGESMLAGRNRMVVARTGTVRPGEMIMAHPAALGDRFTAQGRAWWLERPIGNGQLTLIHSLDIRRTLLRALWNTAHLWLILVLLATMTLLLFALRGALREVTLSTRVDPLTALLNRRGFRSDTEHIYKLCVRHPLPLALLMLDIDHFKAVNDRFGHGDGDRILVEIARTLREGLRPSDLVCRWGGEEFTVFMPDTDMGSACDLAERIRSLIESKVKTPDGLPVTVSVGVAEAPSDGSLDAAVEVADRRLYSAKKGGRNRVCCSDA